MIVECPTCHKRYDVTGRPPGTKARCRCGAMFLLPEPTREALVLSCPTCGAGVSPEARRCSFCEAELLVKACPRCFQRIFKGARHCRMCGAKVEVPAAANADGSARELRCPRCDGLLLSNLIGDTLIDECADCHGIWLDTAAVERIVEEREGGIAGEFAARGSHSSQPAPQPSGPMYVRCPECDSVMNRKNFARSSGVVVDQCRVHGTWFDAGELPRVIDFVARGGLGHARRKELEELERERKRTQARPLAFEPGAAGRYATLEERSPIVQALGLIARAVFDR